MEEVALEALENWYLQALEERFSREHKVLTKFFTMAAKEVAEAKNALTNWLNHKPSDDENPIDEKTQKIMERFIKTVQEAIEELKVPTIHCKISYENCQKFVDGVKKIYLTYNAQGKKAMRRFWKEYKLEIKEIDLHLRKLGNFSQKVGKFMLKNYKEGRDAENLLKKIPILQNNIERLAQMKSKIEELDKAQTQMTQDLKVNEDALYALSEDPDLQKFEELEREEDLKARILRDELKFQKAFKKMKKMLEKGSRVLRGVNEADLKHFMKDPVDNILEEGPKLHRLRDVLIKTRIILEDDSDPLQLKTELRMKIIENINFIVSENGLETPITEILDLREKKGAYRKVLEKKGIEQQRKDLKEKIATQTIDLEHFTNDVQRRKREFKELLDKIGGDREDLQHSIKEETEQEIKLKIVIPA